MTSAARQAEADRVELAYKWALAEIGIAVTGEAISLWHQEIPPTIEPGVHAQRWLSLALKLLSRRRSQAMDLAIAYYRLVRALRTDATMRLPGEKGKSVTLESLREGFDKELDRVEPVRPAEALPQAIRQPTSEATPASTTRAGKDSQKPVKVQGPGLQEIPSELTQAEPSIGELPDEDEQIILEELAKLDEEAARLEQEAQAEAEEAFRQLGLENLRKKLEEAEKEKDLKRREQARDDAMRDAAARQAASAARITMNAARGLAYNLASVDVRVLGWSRYSTTGHPCGWCAMLISRGALYKSKSTASIKPDADGLRVSAGDNNKFHDNDYCIAIPVFFRDQMNSDIFALHRELQALWNKEVKGKFSGDAAIAQFRRLMRLREKTTNALAA